MELLCILPSFYIQIKIMKKKLSILLFILSCFVVGTAIFSCEKEPVVITNTVIQVDTLVVTQIDTLIVTSTDTLILTDTINLIEFIHDTATTFILVRHADIEPFGSNPNLNTAGIERTEILRRALEFTPLTAVFSTNLNRTMQTAQPIADDHSLSVGNYNPFVLDPLVDGVLEEHLAKVVLVVGHGNTTPSLLNLLIGEDVFPELPEFEHDNLYVVTVFEKGRAEVVHLKYGE